MQSFQMGYPMPSEKLPSERKSVVNSQDKPVQTVGDINHFCFITLSRGQVRGEGVPVQNSLKC